MMNDAGSANRTSIASEGLPAVLRAATRHAHHVIDHHPLLAPLVLPGLQLEHYLRVLRTFLWIHTPLQETFARAIEQVGGRYDLADRVSWLRADLVHLGAGVALSEHGWQPPLLRDAAELVGVLYVVEGSTLGGQVIARRVEASLGLGPAHGATFFNGWGAQTEARWSDFWRFAASICPPSGYQAAAIAAVNFFDVLKQSLDQAQSGKRECFPEETELGGEPRHQVL
jgi:heme oxygenase